MIDQIVTILENKKVNGKYYKLTFRSKALSKSVKPGQFLNVQIQPALDPFLRRPFSYYRVNQDRVEVLYEILGRGTAMLADKKKGDTLKVLGALGRPFAFKLPKKKKRVLVAGGVGVPPLVYLAEQVKTDYLLIGTKSKKEVLPKKELSKVRGQIRYSTDDGSYGKKGYVSVLVQELIDENGPEKLFIQTCGPKPMMKAVLALAREYGIEGEASIDNTMACGLGSCLGCMVKTPEGWVPSCTMGPVFSFDQIVEWGD